MKRLRDFVKLASTYRVSGSVTPGSIKHRFKLDAIWVLRQLANRIGLAKGSYDLRFNPGGIAVSGDAILHSDSLYVCMMQSCCGNTGFYFRACEGRKDYHGKANQWMKWEELLNLDTAAARMKKVMPGAYTWENPYSISCAGN